MAKYTIEQWIREALTDEEKDGKCTSIALVHMRGTNEKEVHTTKLGAKQWEPKALATMFRGKAEAYSEELPGVQNFQLQAFYANRGEAQSTKPFMVKGYTEMEGLGTEAPTGAGLTQQAMRHMEAVLQLCIRQNANIFEAQNRTLEALSMTNMQLRNENRDSFEIVKELLMQQADNRHRHRMEELNYERASTERKELMRSAPALVNSVMGREVFPQSSADSALVEMLIDGLAGGAPDAVESNMKKLTELNLPPKVMGALATRFSEGIRSRQMELHARSGNGMDPEDDVIGGPQ